MSTCRRRGRSRAEVRREESARLVEQIAGAVGRLTLGDRALPPEVGLGMLDFYATVTGDSILSAFARGALQHHLAKRADAEAAAATTGGSRPEGKRVDPSGYAATLGQTYSLDEFRARHAQERADAAKKEKKR